MSARQFFSSIRARSYRRLLLDEMLASHEERLRGRVLDIGGKRERKRGEFRTKRISGATFCLNIDASSRPHLLGDAQHLPVAAGSLDGAVCCEVLEHVSDARACCLEIHEALKPGGVFIFTVPFLFPVHADPHDFTRFTADGIRGLCASFDSLDVQPMGSWLGTVGMFLDIGARTLTGGVARTIARRALRVAGRFLCYLDYRGVHRVNAFTTGYFCVATKADSR